MAEFVRSVPSQLVDALGKLAGEKGPNWWKEILDNADLHLAIREDYLNIYAKGQSVFKIRLGKKASDGVRRPVMTTHYKYLLIPTMPRDKQYVTFDGEDFLMKEQPIKPDTLIQTSYISGKTVPRLVHSAISHSNPEKRGVHVIANGNPNVIDMEIAYSKEREPGPEDPSKLDDADDNKPRKAKSTAPRIDLAALFPNGEGKAHLVFYEVKRFDDGRLWGNKPPVLDQIGKYDTFLRSKEFKLKTAYTNVCKLLSELVPKKDLSPLINEVALGLRKLEVDKASRLVVFGFDKDQKKGRLEELKSVLKAQGLADRLIAKGSAKGLTLSR